MARWLWMLIACHPAAAQQAPPLQSGDVLSVAVSASSPVITEIGSSYLGFSYYYSNLHAFVGDDPSEFNQSMVQMLANLGDLQGAPSIRVGGGTVNTTWYSDDGAAPPASVAGTSTVTLTPPFLEVIADTLEAAGSKGIFCLNVGANDLEVFEGMGSGIVGNVGEALIEGFEIGNEPNRYTAKELRPATFDFGAYLQEFDTYLTAYEASVSATIPALGGTFTLTDETVAEDIGWNARAPDFITEFQDRLGAYSMNRYPLSDCTGSPSRPRYPSIYNLLQDRASLGQATAIEPNVVAANGAGLPFYIVEDNSSSCGGSEGVSDTFAAALWFLDSSFAYASVGVDKLFVSSVVTGFYSPFKFTGGTTPIVNPLYYGMLMFAEAVGEGTMLREIDVNRGNGVNTNAWATIDDEGNVSVLLLNKDRDASGSARIYVPRATESASVIRLTAPSERSEYNEGVALAGQTFDGSLDGFPLGVRTSETIPPDEEGIYTVALPKASAALFKFSTNDIPNDLVAKPGANSDARVRELVMLDGTPSLGAIERFRWVQIAGPVASLSDTETSELSFTPQEEGVYVFELTVSRGELSDADMVEVTVLPPLPGPFIEMDGTVAFEAELATAMRDGIDDFADHVWESIPDTTASGGKFMLCGPDVFQTDNGSGDGPALEFAITFTTIGVYKVNVRTNKVSNKSDSFYVGMESPLPGNDGMRSPTDWTWVDTIFGVGEALIEITSPGVQTFRIWPREDGCRVDRIVLSTDLDIDPDSVAASPNDPGDLSLTASNLLSEALDDAGVAGILSTPYDDGVPNLLKHAFNMNLSGPDSSTLDPSGSAGLPTHAIIQDSEGNTIFRMFFVRRKGSSLIYQPMRSSTPKAEDFVAMTGSVCVTKIDSEWDLVTIDEVCDDIVVRCFAHVQVSLP